MGTASNAASVYSFQYADMSRLWLGVDTAAKITATIYGEFCMVDEFLDTCNWTVESGNKIAPGDPALKASYADGYMFPRPFSDPSLTWTNTEIIESVDSKGDTVFTPTPGDDLFLQYTVSGDPKGMAASEIPDPEYGTSPELKFCVRLGLYADTCADTCATCANPDPTCVVSEEINFFES